MAEQGTRQRVSVGIPVSWLDQSIDVLSRVETPLDVWRPASEIYAYILDFPRHVEWAHTYLSVERLTNALPQVGSRFRVHEKQDLRSDKLPFKTIADRVGEDYISEVELTALAADQRVEWTFVASRQRFSAQWQILLEPVTARITTVRMSARLTSSPEALSAWMHELQRDGYPLDILARQVDRALHNLRAILEGRDQGAQPEEVEGAKIRDRAGAAWSREAQPGATPGDFEDVVWRAERPRPQDPVDRELRDG